MESTQDDNIEGSQGDKFERMMDYSYQMTKTLFANQIHSIPDPMSTAAKEASKTIIAKDLYGDIIEKTIQSSHPLVRPSKETSKSNGRPVSTTAPELSIVLRDTQDNSAKALIAPWMNSIDRKANALKEMVRPQWHAPWKLYRMISGHNGWVHSLAIDPSNCWFASGCRDGLIKVWDIASGRLRKTLTGHISGVRGLEVSHLYPYMFSCGDDKMVKCWDLETNQVIRHYHGHLSGVYSLAAHPTGKFLVTGGRDSVARVWDIRTAQQVHCLTGHSDAVGAIKCLEGKIEIITGSYDTTIRLWDMRMGKSLTTLTNHKKSVRALAVKMDGSSFASGATDNIKQWSLPDGQFIQNLSGHESIINSLACNQSDVLVSGADNGTLFFWDWRTGYNFQRLASPAQRGSIESEAGILATIFDRSGSRLITGESDKSIKMFREDIKANEDTHPINWKPSMMKHGQF